MKELDNLNLKEWANLIERKKILSEIIKNEKKRVEKEKEMRLKDVEKKRRHIVK